MKYMHFNSSCAYAGIANLLELQGFDTEDYRIALEMNLPFFLRYDEDAGEYQAGAMLQTSEWFDLYLCPNGYKYMEESQKKDQMLKALKPGSMLGLQVSEQSRHAVIFLGEEDGKYHFLNNKWEASPEPERLELSGEEFLSRVSETVVVGYLEKCEPKIIHKEPYFRESLENWKRLKGDIRVFMEETQSVEALYQSMNRLFRPLLLDGLTMMELLGETQTVSLLRKLQGQYLAQLKENQPCCLAENMDCSLLDEVFERMIGLIRNKV